MSCQYPYLPFTSQRERALHRPPHLLTCCSPAARQETPAAGGDERHGYTAVTRLAGENVLAAVTSDHNVLLYSADALSLYKQVPAHTSLVLASSLLVVVAPHSPLYSVVCREEEK